jgi:hypothetical protein
MPRGPTGGALLSKALQGAGGAGIPSMTGHVGPSDKYYESGASPKDFANKLRQHQTVPGDDKGVNKANDEALSGTRREIQGDPFKVKVSRMLKLGFLEGSSKYLLTEMLQNGSDFWSSPMAPLMPKDMTQDGVLKHPDYFLHGGFNEVSGTTSPSVADATTKHDQGPDAGTDSYENYVQEKDMKDAMRQLQIKKKTASLLIKAGLAAPPVVAGSDPSVPNDATDINTETDLKRRTASAETGKPTFHPRVSRPSNLKLVKKAVGFSFGPGRGGYNAANSGSANPVKQTSQKPPKTTEIKGGKPRRTGMHAEFARSQTAPFQGPKIPSGYPSDDKQSQDAKTASLIFHGFPWR